MALWAGFPRGQYCRRGALCRSEDGLARGGRPAAPRLEAPAAHGRRDCRRSPGSLTFRSCRTEGIHEKSSPRGVFLALAAGIFLFWLAFKGRKAGLGSSAARAAIGCGGAVVVFVAVLAVWGSLFLDEDTVLFEAEGDGQAVPVTLGAATEFMGLIGTSDTVEAEAAATRMVERLREEGATEDELRAVLGGLDEDGGTEFTTSRACRGT